MMDWCRKHLNWTLLLSWLGVPLTLATASGLFGMDYIAMLTIPWLIVVLFIWWWVLSCKGRSHWWMLLGGLGALITLCLRSKESGERIW